MKEGGVTSRMGLPKGCARVFVSVSPSRDLVSRAHPFSLLVFANPGNKYGSRTTPLEEVPPRELIA